MKKFTLLCAAAAIVAPSAAFAQETTSSIRGQVTSGGAAVPNAVVVITHDPSGTTSTVESDSSGAFTASGLRVGGPYSIEVTADGFDTITISDLHLSTGDAFRVPVDLPKQDGTKDIVVTGTRVKREESTGPITALTRTEIEGVASINRDIRDLARRDAFVTMDLTNARTIEVAGNNGRLNRFSVDGVQFSDDFGLNNGGLPTSRGPVPYDAIEQFSIKVAPFDVSEGDFQGGAINVILRSGGNKFKGAAFYSYTDDSLTGDKTGDTEVNLKFDSKQYGGFLSGPIIKDTLFFMLGYEKTKETDPFDDGVGDGFANQVPGVTLAQIDQVSSIAQSVYGYDTLGLIQNAVEEDDKFVAKLDWNINEDHRAQFTYIYNKGTQQFQQNTFLTPQFAIGLQSNGYELKEEVNSGVFQLNSDWTDSFSTELRVSHRDYKRDQTPFGGNEFAQFEVCLDPNSINIGSTNSATSCGSTRVFFGPDVSRHANDLDTKNTSLDLTGRYSFGNHVIKGLIGYTQNKTFNLFVQRALGDYYFDSLADFQNGLANQLRFGAAVPSLDVNDAAAVFRTRNITFGLQDDWDVNDELQLTGGVRVDYFEGDDRPPFNPDFTARYGFTNQHTFDDKYLVQPRFGFNWKPTDRLIVRGGTGVFGGGTPDVFISNSFSNTGQLTNSVTISRTNCAGTSPNTCAALGGPGNPVDGFNIDPSVLQNVVNAASLSLAPVNAIDPDLDVASQWRTSLSVNYDADLGFLGDGWLFGADFLYSDILDAYQWTDLRSVVVGTLPDGRNRYAVRPGGAANSPNQDLLMTNSHEGRSIVAVARFSKHFDFGLDIDGSYTRSDVEDCNAITSATAGSLYSNNAFDDPNRAACGRSIYEIRDQWKFGADFRRKFFGDNETRISLFGEYRTGRPYSLTMLDNSSNHLAVFGTVGNGGRVLMYVPEVNDPLVTYDSTATRDALNAFIEDRGLKRGEVVKKNSEDSPDFFKVDLHVSQEIPTYVLGSKVRLFADVENLLNLIDSDWGALNQVPFPYTSAVVRVTCSATSGPNCTQYRYSSFSSPNEVLSSRQSLYQVRVGARFSF
jgi:outer membrane receptor for ferrienterochelin and colicin